MRILALTVVGLALLASCGKETFPPIVDPPTYTYRSGEFVWHELGCADMAATKEFYGAVFGWTFEDYEIPDLNYSLINYQGTRIGGLVESTVGGMNQWVGAISVRKPGPAIETAVNNGAIELIQNTLVPGRGNMGLIRDPQGALLSIVNSLNGDPESREATSNEWMWMELWTSDPESSAAFYNKFFNFTASESEVDGKPYWVLNYNDINVAGLINNPVENMRSQWIPYIRVEDPGLTARRVKEAGGSVLMAPRNDIRKGTVAVLTDPGGGIFCVQKWPIN